MPNRKPSDFPRRILVAVTGLSPQIVTETLYALAVRPAREPLATASGTHARVRATNARVRATNAQVRATLAAQQSPFVPTEIHLITTASGAQKARLALLSDEPGWFHRLCSDYHLPAIHFTPETIHVLADADGQPLDDIRSPADNRHAADGITRLIRELTADPDSALHVSIAGGRKTMGFFLGYALSLYGRAQDQLSHVLVSQPFESSSGFYYPTPASRVLEMPGGRLVDCAQAEVTLAELPFVSLRHGLPEALLTGQASYNETVEAARRALAPAQLQIDLAARQIRAAGKTIALPPAELALLSVFARRALRGEAPLAAPAKETPDCEWKKRYLVELRWIAGPLADLDDTERALRQGMDGGYFSAHLSKLKRILRRELGPAAAPYLISDGGTRPRLYRLGLHAGEVSYDDFAAAPCA